MQANLNADLPIFQKVTSEEVGKSRFAPSIKRLSTGASRLETSLPSESVKYMQFPDEEDQVY